jgi:SAM-dependent methyltransferase
MTAMQGRYGGDYFEKWNYADRRRGRLSMYWFARRYYAALVKRHAPPGDRRRKLVELGCGLGDLLALLQDDFTAIGVDFLPEAVEVARRTAPGARIELADATDLGPFAAGELDVVVALHLMEHLEDPQRVLREVHARLTPGGLLLFATPHPEYALRWRKDRTTDAIGKDPTHVNCHVPAVWRRWGEDAGFTVVRQWGDGLWDVPYIPLAPKPVQLAVFGLPAMFQVLTRSSFIPTRWGVNQINVFRKR